MLIAGALWMSDGDTVIRPDIIWKHPDYEVVNIRTASGAFAEFSVQQYQLRMGTDEFLADCIATAIPMPEPGGTPMEIDPEQDDGTE